MRTKMLWLPGGLLMVHPSVSSRFQSLTRQGLGETSVRIAEESAWVITDIATLLQFHKNGKTIRALPPSAILEAAYNNANGGLPNLEYLAKRCCLTEQQIQMWWDHLQQNAMNRAKGVEKAKATRLRKKQQKNMT